MHKEPGLWSTEDRSFGGTSAPSESRELAPIARSANLPVPTSSQPVPVSTDGEQVVSGKKARAALFRPGVSGNPAGRPRGSKNKLTELFLKTIVDDFATHGAEAISTLRKRDPATYVRLIAFLVPRDLVLKSEQSPDYDYASMTEQEIVSLLDERRRQKMIEEVMKQTE